MNEDEIKDYYSVDYPTPKDSVLYYDFSDVRDDVVYDMSGNQNHGYLDGCSIEEEVVGKISNTILPFRNRLEILFSRPQEKRYGWW